MQYSGISCPDIAIPRDGLMECDLGFKFGSECKFECMEGFELRGREITQCGADGEWTSRTPRCARKFMSPHPFCHRSRDNIQDNYVLGDSEIEVTYLIAGGVTRTLKIYACNRFCENVTIDRKWGHNDNSIFYEYSQQYNFGLWYTITIIQVKYVIWISWSWQTANWIVRMQTDSNRCAPLLVTEGMRKSLEYFSLGRS